MHDSTYYNTLYRLWSVIAFGAGTRLLQGVTSAYDTAENMYISLTNGGEDENVPAEAFRIASEIPLQSAEKIMDFCDKKHISIITKEDELYPRRLLSVYNTPAVLFCKGDISGIDERLSISVVGARKPSEYSRKITAGIVSVLSRQGFDIVSGFAEGVDICAHMTAVKNGARTFAVLGCGLDVVYPKPNEKYKHYITENGALISEYLPSTQPYPANFPHRNRLIAGLSMGTAVIEAGAKSGSLNTASHASTQGKPVFAVPPCDLYDDRYRGNVDIIRHGAAVLMGARDIYSEYCTGVPHTIVETEGVRNALEELRKATEKAEKASANKTHEKKAAAPLTEKVDEPEKSEKPENIAQPPSSDDPSENAVLRAIYEHGSALRADEIALICDMDIGEVLTVLTGMEISGAVAGTGGKYSLT